MHLYKKENFFFGGWGIVGTSPPLGTGLALGQKIEKKGKVTAAIYGDGFANQVILKPTTAVVSLPEIAADHQPFSKTTTHARNTANVKSRVGLLCLEHFVV